MRLSARNSERERLRLGRRSRHKRDGLAGKPEAFRTGGGKAATQSRNSKPQPKAAPKAENEQASTRKVAYNLDHDG